MKNDSVHMRSVCGLYILTHCRVNIGGCMNKDKFKRLAKKSLEIKIEEEE